MLNTANKNLNVREEYKDIQLFHLSGIKITTHILKVPIMHASYNILPDKYKITAIATSATNEFGRE